MAGIWLTLYDTQCTILTIRNQEKSFQGTTLGPLSAESFKGTDDGLGMTGMNDRLEQNECS